MGERAAESGRGPPGLVRILEWVAMPSFRGSSPPRVEPISLMCPAMASGIFTTRAIREAQQ